MIPGSFGPEGPTSVADNHTRIPTTGTSPMAGGERLAWDPLLFGCSSLRLMDLLLFMGFVGLGMNKRLNSGLE